MFKITVPIYETRIVKSINEAGDEILKRRIVGIASGTELDRDEEEFALSALKAMQRAIEDGITLPDGTHSLVPLQSDHKASWLTDLGFLTKAWIEEGDENHNLWIEAELNDSPSADYFYKLLTEDNTEKGRPTKLGLSIGGLVTKAHKKINSVSQKAHLVFEHILLKEVSVVSWPAYPTQYLQALTKSYQQKEAEEMEDLKNKEQTEEEVRSIVVKEEAVTEEETTEAVAKNEAEETEEGVTKAVSPEDFEEVSKEVREVKKAVADIAEILTQMKASYASLSIGFQANRDELGNVVDAQKSVTEEANVEKSESEPVDTDAVVQKALNDAFVMYTDKAIGPIVQMIGELTARVEELATQPVDKSLRVSTVEEEPKTPKEVYERKKSIALASGDGRFDSIAAAVEATFANR